jgi:hypothetical protein
LYLGSSCAYPYYIFPYIYCFFIVFKAKDINAARDTLSGGGGMSRKTRIVESKKGSPRGLICFALAAVFFVSPAFAAGSVRVDKVDKQVSDSTLKCRIVYPHISGLDDENRQQRLNVAFMERAKTVCTRAKYEAKSGTVNANMDFKVTHNHDGVMSLVMKESINAGSGEKFTQTGVTIDTVTGRRYLISDLFIDNADYVATLSAQVKSQIERMQPRLKQVKEFAEISDNAEFYLTDDTLVVFFRQGEYFSSECAVKEFAIPLKTLEEILKPQFIDKV